MWADPLPGSTGNQSQPINQQPRHRDSIKSIDDISDHQDVSDSAVQWMPLPSTTMQCPPGLQYLISLDELILDRQEEVLDIMSGLEGNYRYIVKNRFGELIYAAAETATPFKRQCLGTCREFHLKIIDSSGQEVIHVHRPCRCNCWCFPWNSQIIEVEAPVGTIIGRVTEDWNFCTPKYRITDPEGTCELTVKGPFCTCSLCGDAVFHLLDKDGITHVGKITKHWTEVNPDLFKDTDNFGISFPISTSPEMKAVLIASVFLIDFMFFENTVKSQRRGK
ncbi:phospholipid scramblase 1-like [Centruroides vittatus]|uniref:phospholipid scramblase 1-like n=1 Tax=Centruroides vittatus TaxID=120091 RepID=UPI0035105C97